MAGIEHRGCRDTYCVSCVRTIGARGTVLRDNSVSYAPEKERERVAPNYNRKAGLPMVLGRIPVLSLRICRSYRCSAISWLHSILHVTRGSFGAPHLNKALPLRCRGREAGQITEQEFSGREWESRKGKMRLGSNGCSVCLLDGESLLVPFAHFVTQPAKRVNFKSF